MSEIRQRIQYILEKLHADQSLTQLLVAEQRFTLEEAVQFFQFLGIDLNALVLERVQSVLGFETEPDQSSENLLNLLNRLPESQRKVFQNLLINYVQLDEEGSVH